MIKGSKVLVTGYKGFIGNHLCYVLKYKGAKVTGMEDKNGGVINLKLLYEKCRNIDYVFHLAAISTIPACANNPLKAHDINVTGTLNVLLASKACRVKKVVFVSSSVVHDPRTVYAVMKTIGEMYCKLFSNMFGLPVSILRLYNVYGVGQDSDTAVVPSFIRQLKEDKLIIIEGSGEQTRDFVYVEDVVDAMIQTVEDNLDGYYNIGTGRDISISDLAYLIGKIMNKPVRIEHTTGRAGDVDKSVARKPEWFEPKYSLTEGLTKTIESWK